MTNWDPNLEALQHQLADVIDELADLSVRVTDLAAEVAALTKEHTETPTAPCWVDLDQNTAEKAWAALRAWVIDVLFGRYPHTADQHKDAHIPPCWYRHPSAVEELSALHVTWCAAFRDPTAQPTTANEWHRRLTDAVSRIGDQLNCKGGHYDDSIVQLDDEFDAFVAADVLSRPIRPQPNKKTE
jgi:hypothetical protein